MRSTSTNKFVLLVALALLCISAFDILSIPLKWLHLRYVFGVRTYRVSSIDSLRILSAISIIVSIILAKRREWWGILTLVMAANIASYFLTADPISAFYPHTGPGSVFNWMADEYLFRYAGAVIMTLGLVLVYLLFGYGAWRTISKLRASGASFP